MRDDSFMRSHPALLYLLTCAGATSLDLAAAVDEFKKICTTWDKYNAEMNYLHVIRTKKSVVIHLSLHQLTLN